jgi:hypothetical protein
MSCWVVVVQKGANPDCPALAVLAALVMVCRMVHWEVQASGMGMVAPCRLTTTPADTTVQK